MLWVASTASGRMSGLGRRLGGMLGRGLRGRPGGLARERRPQLEKPVPADPGGLADLVARPCTSGRAAACRILVGKAHVGPRGRLACP